MDAADCLQLIRSRRSIRHFGERKPDRCEIEQIIEALNNELALKPISDYIKTGIHEALEIVAGPESFISEWKDFSTFFVMLQYRILTEKPNLRETLLNIQRANPMN